MLTFIPANAQHIGARTEQQDSFAFSDPGDKAFVAHGGLLGMVADGMGGLEGGREASHSAVMVFLQAYARKSKTEPIQVALQRALQEANAAVLTVSRRINADKGTGTTLVAMVLYQSSLYWISVGDSRLYLLREGQLARINADHTQRSHLFAEVAAGRLDREAALIDPQAAHLTSYLGLSDLPLIDFSVRPFPLLDGDVILACTDGIYRGVSEDQIIHAFQNSGPGAACEAIQSMTLAKASAKQDNLTVIAVQCHADQSAARPPSTALPGKARQLIMASALFTEVLLAGGLAEHLVNLQRHSSQANGGLSLTAQPQVTPAQVPPTQPTPLTPPPNTPKAPLNGTVPPQPSPDSHADPTRPPEPPDSSDDGSDQTTTTPTTQTPGEIQTPSPAPAETAPKDTSTKDTSTKPAPAKQTTKATRQPAGHKPTSTQGGR
jgi:protein phosphatase